METEAERMQREAKESAVWQDAYDAGYQKGRDAEANWWIEGMKESDEHQRSASNSVRENLLPYLKAMKKSVEAAGDCDTLSPEHYAMWMHVTSDVDWLIELAEDIAQDLEESDGS
jgi:hypothetical protein